MVLILEYLIIQRLKKQYHSIYCEIGEPNSRISFSMKKMKALTKYILKREYRALNDQMLNLLGNLYIVGIIATIVILVLFSTKSSQ